MAMPKQVADKLREVLGKEVGDSMSEWLDNLDERSEDVRQEFRADMAEVRQEIHALRAELRVGMAELREELRVGVAKVSEQTAKQIADVLKWMVGVWIGSFAALVAVLALLKGLR